MKTMKITNRLIGMLCIAVLLLGCTKEEGTMGLQGPMGEQGIAGQQGPAGEDGQDGEALGVPGPQGEQGEPGADGAQGPQGEQGEAGAQGPTGLQGEQGETGSANVIYSNWIASEFPSSINSDFDQWEMFAPELTQEIHDTGVILVYARKGNLIYPVPVTFFDTIDESWNFRLLDINDTMIAVRVHSVNGGTIGQPYLNGDFRYILIPGGVVSSGKTTSADYSKMSYDEITSHFNIPK